MNQDQLDELLQKGIEAAEKGYIHSAQVFLGQVADQHKTPLIHSYLAYCLAKGQGRMPAAAKICRESIKREPNNSIHYLLLGRILLLTEDKGKAIETFRRGLRAEQNQQIVAELQNLGVRKQAVLKSLKRNHPLNRALGKIFGIIGLR